MKNNKEGGVEYLSAIMLICLTSIFLLYGISFKEVTQYQHAARDSLDGACLAAALIDKDICESDNKLTLLEHDYLYEVFRETLKSNMSLDSDNMPPSGSVYGKVNIHRFITYNIIDDNLCITESSCDNGKTVSTCRYTGQEKTPEGILIESATIYADIGMEVTSFGGLSRYVHVTSSVDVIGSLVNEED